MSDALHLQDPWVLALLLLLPILAIRRHRQRGYGAMTYSSLPLRLGGGWRLHLPFYLRLIALGLLIVAASRPQLGFTREENLTEGIDIQVVLDVSGSMSAEDFQPRNRLEVAKDVTQEFISKRVADRIGIVIFAGQALTKAPLTSDHPMLQLLLESVALETLPDGTAIGLALANAAARLKDSAAKTKVVVLLTDGVNNRGAIDPDSAAAVCEGLGIKVYTIGVGTQGVIEVDATDPFGRAVRQKVQVEFDEELLRRVAERTGGKFFHATDPESLRDIFNEIDELEKTPLRVKRYIRYNETFQPLVHAALILLAFPLLLGLLGLTVEP